VTSAEPTGGASTWHRVTTADTVGLGVPVSCPTTSLCVAIDGAGRVATSTAPGAATPVWNVAAPISGSLPVNALSCPSVSLCVAVDNSGNVLTSNNPTGGPATWTTAAVHPGGQLVDVSCASNRSLNADARKRRREGFWQADRDAASYFPSWSSPCRVLAFGHLSQAGSLDRAHLCRGASMRTQ